mgnify:CR=1 FL=1
MRLLQLLREVQTVMSSRKIAKLAEHPVVVLAVEVRRLKTECVQIGVLGAASTCFLFGEREELVSVSLTAEIATDPEQVNVEPLPVSFPDDAASDFLIRREESKAQKLALIGASLLFVVVPNAAADDIPHKIVGLFYVENLITFSHESDPSPFLSVLVCCPC